MAGSITKQFDFIINLATHAVSKKCDLKLPRSTSFNYFVAESITVLIGGLCVQAAQAACTPLPTLDEIHALDARTRDSQAYEQERMLREFVLFSSRKLANDIINGSGPYLDTIASFFPLDCADDSKRRQWLRDVLANAESGPAFARQLSIAHALANVKTDALCQR
jgi:hypothetical protein